MMRYSMAGGLIWKWVLAVYAYVKQRQEEVLPQQSGVRAMREHVAALKVAQVLVMYELILDQHELRTRFGVGARCCTESGLGTCNMS